MAATISLPAHFDRQSHHAIGVAMTISRAVTMSASVSDRATGAAISLRLSMHHPSAALPAKWPRRRVALRVDIGFAVRRRADQPLLGQFVAVFLDDIGCLRPFQELDEGLG